MTRCFIAISLPEEIKEELARVQNQLPEADMKLIEKENFHLTLHFFGELTEQEIEKVKKSLYGIKFDKFSAELGKIGVFPSDNFIRVVWVSLESEKIKELRNKIEEIIPKVGQKDEKAFKTHLTISRVKYIKDTKAFIENLKKIETKNLKFEINSFSLKKSTLTVSSPVYEDVEVFHTC